MDIKSVFYLAFVVEIALHSIIYDVFNQQGNAYMTDIKEREMAFQGALRNLDLTDIVATVQTDLGLNDNDTQRAEALYRQYLTLRFKYPQLQVVPPRLVDEVWHMHIMHTKKYAEDCDKLFGKFVHHNPGLSDAEEEYKTTKKLYQEEFDVDLDMCGVSKADMMLGARCN